MNKKQMTCGEHASLIAKLIPVKTMGPNLKPFYEKMKADGDETCILAESQVLYAAQALASRDINGLPPERKKT